MRYLMVIFVSFSMVFGACASKEPPVSKAAQVFKKELKDSLERLSPLFVEPTSKQNIEAINQILDKRVSDSEKTGHPMAFGIVLPGSSISLAGIVEISKPAYAQKIKTRADPKFSRPYGEKG